VGAIINFVICSKQVNFGKDFYMTKKVTIKQNPALRSEINKSVCLFDAFRAT